MTTFWIAITFLFLLALIIVWYAFFAKQAPKEAHTKNLRKDTNVSLYHEHLKEIEKDLSEGAIDQDNYEQLKSELEKTLLQDVNAAELAPKVADKTNKTSILWPISLSIFIGVVSFVTYFEYGSSMLLSQPAVVESADPHADLDMNQQALFRVQQLEQRVAAEPTNSQAWFSLAQAYITVGQFDDAVATFDQVITLIGEYAELIGPKAQALYYKNNQQLNEEIQALIDKALSLDPVDPATNILLGMDSYGQGDFSSAINHWEKVLNSGRQGINTQALVGAINEAKSQLQMSDGMATATESQPVVATAGPRLTIDVSFTEQVLEQIMKGSDKTIFVYATPATGPRMPLAAVKIKASDLPTTIVLDDSLAMTPQMKLSSVDKVNLYAVVSMQGSVGIKPGDYKAELIDFDAKHQGTIQLTIDTLVK